MPEPILLKCGCWKDFVRPRPRLGDELSCRVHGATEVVRSVNYKIHCEHCRYRRHIGNAPVTAQARAAKHSLTRHHTVRVLKFVDSIYESETKVGGNQNLTLDETLGT